MKSCVSIIWNKNNESVEWIVAFVDHLKRNINFDIDIYVNSFNNERLPRDVKYSIPRRVNGYEYGSSILNCHNENWLAANKEGSYDFFMIIPTNALFVKPLSKDELLGQISNDIHFGNNVTSQKNISEYPWYWWPFIMNDSNFTTMLKDENYDDICFGQHEGMCVAFSDFGCVVDICRKYSQQTGPATYPHEEIWQHTILHNKKIKFGMIVEVKWSNNKLMVNEDDLIAPSSFMLKKFNRDVNDPLSRRFI